MSAPLSVIIPTLNAVERIGPTLGALVAGAGDGLVREVIFADGGSTDDIVTVADECGATIVKGEPGRGGQLHTGAQAARGEWLLFLHADTLLPDNWVEVARSHMQRHGGKAAYFKLSFDSDRQYARWTEGWANIRARVLALPYGDQGLLIRRALYEEIGGFPQIPLMEDVALVRKLGRRRLRALPAPVLTSADKYESEGYWKRGWRNWGCLTLYFAGVSPDKIAERYRK